MRRFFGSKVVLATKTSESSRGAPKKPQNVRSHLTRPQATWWPAQGRDGLSLHAYNESEVSEKLTRQKWSPMQEKWWTVEYSRKYKWMTREFMGVVMAGGGSKRAFLNIVNTKFSDPQGLFNQLGQFPWHADTLLQIAEVYRHREGESLSCIDYSLTIVPRACISGRFHRTISLHI